MLLIQIRTFQKAECLLKYRVTISFPRPFRILESRGKADLSSFRKACKIVPIPLLFLVKSWVTQIKTIFSIRTASIVFSVVTIAEKICPSCSIRDDRCSDLLSFSVIAKFQGRDVSLFWNDFLKIFTSRQTAHS